MFIFTLAVINPFNSPRFYLIGTYAPSLYSLFAKRIKILPFVLFLGISLYVLMPIMSKTTRTGKLGDTTAESIFHENGSKLQDMDAAQMVILAVNYAETIGYTNGDCLKAIIGFFVPRKIWPGKPVESGMLVGGEWVSRGYAGTDNLSSPIVDDFYLDYGILGVILGMIFLSTIVAIVLRNPFSFNSSVIVGFLPILIRGPLGSVIGLPLLVLVWGEFLPRILKLSQISAYSISTQKTTGYFDRFAE
jgi:hypothetical protein